MRTEEAAAMQKTPLIDVGSTQVVTFPHLRVPHGCSTRVGGVSSAPWSSLNTGFTVGDDPTNVWENRSRFARCLGVDDLPWLLSMTHGKSVAEITSREDGAIDRRLASKPNYAADACITNRPGVPLNLTVADCVPVFFHDPRVRAIGLAHAGWRGTVQGIVQETIRAMVAAFGSRPDDILVGVGPSIGPKAFEVGSEVSDEFSTVFPEDGLVVSIPDRPGKALVDLWQANALMANRAGVPSENIMISGWCTVSHPDLFFSHRRDQGKTGRLLAGIIL